jgi:hypothetical protein
MDHDGGLLCVTSSHKSAQNTGQAENNCIVHFYENVAAVTGLPFAEMPASCSPSQENDRSLSAPAV